MIDFITQNKGLVVIGVIILLAFNNRESLSFLWRWIPGFFSIFKFNTKTKRATPDDRKDLYDCLIQLQDYLAVCGVDRQSATTPLKPSLESEHPDQKLLDGA